MFFTGTKLRDGHRDLCTGCGADCGKVRPLGEWMRKWKALVLPLVQEGKAKGDFRRHTDGMSEARPPLYRYKEKPTQVSPSNYASEGAGT